jgi:hypothetical protein
MTYRFRTGVDVNSGLARDFLEISLDIVTERASGALITADIGRYR